MAINQYFTQGTGTEQNIIEDLIVESLAIYGQDFYYIPRQLVSKDDILGEDRLSEFKQAFPIEAYFENVDNFEGQGAFISKFGLMMEQSATLIIARRRWEQLIGRFDATIIPSRPCEGDLLYFGLTKGLFEIKFVKHQDPFYQLGKLYVYKLQVELFQYSSERLDTGIPAVDVFESLKTLSEDPEDTVYGEIQSISMTSKGTGYTSAVVTIESSSGQNATAAANIMGGMVDSITITNPGREYTSATVIITGDGTGASAEATIFANVDKVESYGDNNKFQAQAESFMFDTNNPFGEV